MHLSRTILYLMCLILASCVKAGMDDDSATIRLSILDEATLETKAGIIDNESALDEVIFVAYSKSNGECLWSGKGNEAAFNCRKGATLRIIALCNYYDLIDVPHPGESMETLGNETLEWDNILHIIHNKKVIPMYGEIEFTPYLDQESVSIAVKRICNKIMITGSVMASGDVRDAGVDFGRTDPMTVLLSHNPSCLRLNGTPYPDCDELPDMELSDDLCTDLSVNGFVGAYFPNGTNNTLVFQFEHGNRTWHYPVPLGGSDTNTEYRIQGITIGRFVDWDEEWMSNDVGIKITEWKQNHSILETI